MTAYAVIGTASRATGLDLSAALTSPGGTSGDTFPPGNDVFLRLKTTGTPLTATIMNTGANSGLAGTFLAPYAMGGGALAATQDKLYGPFPSNPFGDPSDGQVHIAYTVVTGLTVGVYRMAQS